MRRPVSRRDALRSQLETHSKCKRRPAMRKDTSRNKQQIRSKAERATREGLEFYIGIDLGDKNSDVCVLDRRGELSKEFRLRMKEEDFQTYFASIPRSRVAVEAGAQSRWVAEVIEKCGHGHSYGMTVTTLYV